MKISVSFETGFKIVKYTKGEINRAYLLTALFNPKHSLFIEQVGQALIALMVYVDDIAIAGLTQTVIEDQLRCSTLRVYILNGYLSLHIFQNGSRILIISF